MKRSLLPGFWLVMAVAFLLLELVCFFLKIHNSANVVAFVCLGVASILEALGKSDEKRFIAQAVRLELKEGDVLVLTLPSQIPHSAVENIVSQFSDAFPGRKCVVLFDSMALSSAGDK